MKLTNILAFLLLYTTTLSQEVKNITSVDSPSLFEFDKIGLISDDFYRSIDVGVVGDEFLIFDRGNNRFYFYNSDFEKQRVINIPEGSGPGELKGRGSLYANDSHFIVNRGSSLLLFDKSGKFIRQHKGIFYYSSLKLFDSEFKVYHYKNFRKSNPFIATLDFNFNLLKKEENKVKTKEFDFYQSNLDDLVGTKQIIEFQDRLIGFGSPKYVLTEFNNNGIPIRFYEDVNFKRLPLEKGDLLIPKVTGTTAAESKKMQAITNMTYEVAFNNLKPAINKIIGIHGNYLFLSRSSSKKNVLKIDVLKWSDNSFTKLETIDLTVENIQPRNIENLVKAKILKNYLFVMTSNDSLGPYVLVYKIMKK